MTRFLAWLIAKFGEEVLEWTVRRLFAEMQARPELSAEVPDVQGYVWEDRAALLDLCEDDPCRPFE